MPIPPGLARRLERQVRSRTEDTRSERLFLSLRRGRDGEYGSLTVSGISQLLQVAAERAGLKDRRVHPHALRHAFITNALRGGMNPMVVKQIVGHESLRMIESVYAHLTDTDAHAAMIRLFSAETK